MSYPQDSCPICASNRNSDQTQYEQVHPRLSKGYDDGLHSQEFFDQIHPRRTSNLRLAQNDEKLLVQHQQTIDQQETKGMADAGTVQTGSNRTIEKAEDGRRSNNTLDENGQISVQHENGPEEGHEGAKNVTHKRSQLRTRIANFQWTWFSCTMSTGGLAILLSEQPHAFRGLETIGKILFIIELVLFIIFTCAIGLRFVLEPKALRRSLVDPTESFFFGCFWLSQATIIVNIERYGVPNCGPWLIKTQEVLLWYYVGSALLVAIFIFSTHYSHHNLSIEKVQPAWVLGIYPIMLAGTLTSLLAPSQPTPSALAMIIGGFAFQGLGFMFSFMLITIFLWRCFHSGLPQPQVRVGMFIIVGAPGYTATALQGLATAATKHFPPGYMGVSNLSAADVLVVGTIALGAWFWLLSFMFFMWSLVCVALGAKKMTFDVTWWASIFPNVGWVVATSLLGQNLQSQGIQWVAQAMTIILVAFWLFVASFHLMNVFQGRAPPIS